MADKSIEQQARDLLERMGVKEAQSLSSGDVVELANLINDTHKPVTMEYGKSYILPDGRVYVLHSLEVRAEFARADLITKTEFEARYKV
jgi:hypothetical protein